MHKHHIVFRSQGGMDLKDNLIDLSYIDHEGDNGPHQSREADLKLKIELQNFYFELFDEEEYTVEQIAKKLRKSEKYIFKRFRKVKNWAGVYQREDIVRRLMGSKTY